MSECVPLSAIWTTATRTFENEICRREDVQSLLKEATEIAKNQPLMVEFFDESSGLSFALGVGRDLSVATFQESFDPPYFISLGDADAKGVLEFCYANEATEYWLRNAVFVAEAIQALEWFVQKRSIPPMLAWERL